MGEDTAFPRNALARHQEDVESRSFCFPPFFWLPSIVWLHGQRMFIYWGLFASGKSISTDG